MHVTVYHMGIIHCGASKQRGTGGISISAGSSEKMLYIDVPENRDLVALLDPGWFE